MGAAQPRPGIDAVAVGQSFSDPLVDRQCVGLASTAVQRHHREVVAAFAQRMGVHEAEQFGQRLTMPSTVQFGGQSRLQRRQPTLHPLGTDPLGGATTDAAQRRAGEPGFRVPQQLDRPVRVSPAAGTAHGVLELGHVHDGVAGKPQRVAAAPQQHLASGPGAVELAAQRRDVGAQRVLGAGRGIVPPHPVDEFVDAEHPAVAEQQRRQHRARPGSAQPQFAVTAPGADRAEHVDAQRLWCGHETLRSRIGFRVNAIQGVRDRLTPGLTNR
ncbi:hypothetical protein Snas_5533 [Stackebrandtia nassauensis DSM 44728]|uniref:Uncharacterized protein n=1 Tax=Stackebrandtia nassauensis (strain DSM 44728 / CIP 108903 / NRRL B-16338 / NBRC 102104 / LLR-40K-21) TaxID=446470 RepID=D3PWU0_STANL|nr:hypothetical protein Snas_5533 [Stackebrandtia nassauensis DSM 44728]